MLPAEQDLENRRPVWAALSELFLDTELEEEQLSSIARVLAESPYTLVQAERILFREVYPVCSWNLCCVAGEWNGFDEQWLEDAILRRSKRGWLLGNFLQLNRPVIRNDWNRVKELFADHG